MGGRCFVANGGAHILFSGKKCMKLKEIGLKNQDARQMGGRAPGAPPPRSANGGQLNKLKRLKKKHF